MRRWFVLAVLLGCLVSPRSATSNAQPKIVVVGLDQAELKRMRDRVPEARIVGVDGRDAALAEVRDADALVGRLDPELFAAGKRLRWVQVYSAGVDRYVFPELVDSDVVLTNAKVLQGPNVADHALALLLVLTRGIDLSVAQRDRQDWSGTRSALKQRGLIELKDKVALVIGLGGIGRAIAERAHGFGMVIEAVDPKVDKPRADYVRRVEPPDNLLVALGRADVVFNAVPLTAKTDKMLGPEELRSMKDGALLINIGRGRTVDTNALVAALKSGKLAGAGLDVTDPEPLPAGHPLWSLNNVVITPHVAGSSDQVWGRKLDLLETNLRRFVGGEPLENIVDKRKGY